MVLLKPAWLFKQNLPNQFSQVTPQLRTSLASSNDPIELLEKFEILLAQVHQDPPASIQDALVPLKEVLLSKELANHPKFDVQISLALCLSELIRISAPDPPFEDELMKKAFQVIVSSFEALPDSNGNSYHKRCRILESMSRVKSYVVLLDLECDGLVLNIFNHLLASPGDDHSSMTLAYVESILVGILTEADDLLLEFLISILYRSHQVISQRVLDACASRIPLQQIISSIDEITQIKENGIKEGSNEEGIGFKNADKESENATYECKTLPNSKDFWSWCLEFCHLEISRLEDGHFNLLIPNALLVGKKLHPLIGSLLFWAKWYKL